MGSLLWLVYIFGVNSAQLNSTIVKNVTNLNTIKLTNTSTSTKLVNTSTSTKLTSTSTSTKLVNTSTVNKSISNTTVLNTEIINPIQKSRTEKNIIKIFVALLVVFICLSILFICKFKLKNKRPTIDVSPSSINIRETFNPYERTNEKCYRRISATNSPV